MLEKIEGIVVSETSYGESSKIINILTLDYGIVGIMAKGAKKVKSEFRTLTSKLTYAYFHVYYKKDKLSTLVAIDKIDTFKNITKDITLISYATFLLDLSEQVMRHSGSNEVFKILISALKKINDKYDPLVITNIVELKYLKLLGVMPVLEHCAGCGSTNNIITLSNIKGGYICSNCHTSERLVTSDTLKFIRGFYYIDIDKISKLEIDSKIKNEINTFLDDYYDTYTGIYLKSKDFLKNLNKL